MPYALGVTLLWALEGAPPFEVRCVQDLIDRGADGTAPPPVLRGGVLEALVRGLLRPRLQDRWSLDVARRFLQDTT